MPFRPTWAAMFEPELYPPPPLTGFGFAWRYAVAIGSFFAMAAVWVLAFQARSTCPGGRPLKRISRCLWMSAPGKGRS